MEEPEISKGDDITCVNDYELFGNKEKPKLKRGEKYKAQEIFTCSCGSKHIDVGLNSILNYIRCWDCRKELPHVVDGNKRVIHWCHHTRFVKTVQMSEKAPEISVKQEEEQDMAEEMEIYSTEDFYFGNIT